MTDSLERQIGGLRVVADRHICIRSGTCVATAPEIFDLDPQSVVVFREQIPELSREEVLEGCRACPIGALEAFDASGRRLVP